MRAKRFFDVLASAVLLVLLMAPLAVIAILVKLNLGSPVLFRQKRPGRGGAAFEILKFRTMKDAVDSDGNLLADELRLTRFGRFLRASSLDELPELLNVLRGDMSLVGPRPLLMSYLPRYTAEQRRRHEVPPGITGWAQVNGRNSISWEAKFELDVWYVDHRTLLLDLRILMMTISRIVRPEGISAAGHVTMPEFLGTGATETR